MKAYTHTHTHTIPNRYETIKFAAEQGQRNVVEWLAKRFKMKRAEMIKYVC